MTSEEENLIRVKTKKGMGKQLAQLFGVTPEYVSMCTCGRTCSELACKIRQVAVEMGGDPIFGIFVPKVSKVPKPKLPTINRILAEKFGVTTQTIRNARREITQSELARKIRKSAVEMGGDAIYESSNN